MAAVIPKELLSDTGALQPHNFLAALPHIGHLEENGDEQFFMCVLPVKS